MNAFGIVKTFGGALMATAASSVVKTCLRNGMTVLGEEARDLTLWEKIGIYAAGAGVGVLASKWFVGECEGLEELAKSFQKTIEAQTTEEVEDDEPSV